MGFLTLDDFREDLSAVIGQPGQSNRWLDRRINAGYLEVATGSTLRHEELRARITVNTGVSQGFIDLDISNDIVGVESVLFQDSTEEKQYYLAFTEDIDQYKREGSIGSNGGRPKVWTVEGASAIGRRIQLRPVPDDAYPLVFVLYLEPNPLALATDTSLLNNRWDQAIGLMAAHYALLDLEKTERATGYFERARLYMSTRSQDGSERRSSHHVPMASPLSFEELMRARMVP